MAESISREPNKRRNHKNDCKSQKPNDFFFSDSEVEAGRQLIQLREEDSDCNYSAGSGSSSIRNCITGVAESIIGSNSITGNAIKQIEELSEADPATPSSRAIGWNNNIFTREEEEEDQSNGYSRRRKTKKKLRSVYEIYSLTKPVVVCK